MEIGLIIVVVLLLVLTVVPTLLFESRVRAGLTVERRPLSPLWQIERAMNRAAETGRPIHLTPGAGPLSGRIVAPETFAGLVLARQLAEAAARRGASVTASSGDAVAHLALRGVLRQAYHHAGYPEGYSSSTVHLYAHSNPLAFAAGVGSRYTQECFESSIAIGAFGPYYLLIGAQGAQQQLPQIAGTVLPESLAAMVLTSGATLMGEEIYAAEAYVAPSPAGFSRLLTHDLLRALVIGLLIIGLILQALNATDLLNIPLPF